MGPVITAAHRDKIAGYIGAGDAAGATVVVDGRDLAVDDRPDGFFIGPTLLDHVTTEMTVYTDEIFGPVLTVVRAGSYDEAVRLVNENAYGNGVALFTSDGGAARRFQFEVEAGMVGINVPIPVPMAYYSFRRLEPEPLRRHPHARHRGRALLHAGQGHHVEMARPRCARFEPGSRSRVPDARLNGRRVGAWGTTKHEPDRGDLMTDVMTNVTPHAHRRRADDDRRGGRGPFAVQRRHRRARARRYRSPPRPGGRPRSGVPPGRRSTGVRARPGARPGGRAARGPHRGVRPVDLDRVGQAHQDGAGRGGPGGRDLPLLGRRRPHPRGRHHPRSMPARSGSASSGSSSGCRSAWSAPSHRSTSR